MAINRTLTTAQHSTRQIDRIERISLFGGRGPTSCQAVATPIYDSSEARNQGVSVGSLATIWSAEK
jgi:hypothetical protein